MDAIREQLEKPLVAGIVFFVIGLLIGLVVLGWGLWPVQWTDAGPADLRADAQEDHLRMAIDSNAYKPDQEKAQRRFSELGEGANDLFAQVQANPGDSDLSAIEAFRQAIEVQAPAPTEEGATEGGGSNLTLLLVMCLVTVVLAGALAAYFLLRKGPSTTTASPASQAQEFSNQVERTDYAALGQETPMSQFMTTYLQGDDLFDDSFSIDSPSGEFLGECGVGISEAIGVGEPKKVTAFEIWLFDKNDIQTVTKVLMSSHAFTDETLRQRLAAKGEPFQSNPGAEMVLETATLRLVARVVDMNYGSGAMPAGSYFERVTLELAVWQKPQS
ncbi:MAG TPA: hypothetical protein DEH25_05865 [Chloroflexi bacterium]|nr:hypothetical protein [Chloroflexota bacterium]HBY07762.1 hypothetical protein [Chloroflexota bacterium]